MGCETISGILREVVIEEYQRQQCVAPVGWGKKRAQIAIGIEPPGLGEQVGGRSVVRHDTLPTPSRCQLRGATGSATGSAGPTPAHGCHDPACRATGPDVSDRPPTGRGCQPLWDWADDAGRKSLGQARTRTRNSRPATAQAAAASPVVWNGEWSILNGIVLPAPAALSHLILTMGRMPPRDVTRVTSPCRPSFRVVDQSAPRRQRAGNGRTASAGWRNAGRSAKFEVGTPRPEPGPAACDG